MSERFFGRVVDTTFYVSTGISWGNMILLGFFWDFSFSYGFREKIFGHLGVNFFLFRQQYSVGLSKLKVICPLKRFVGKKMFRNFLIFYVIFAFGEDFFEWFLKFFFSAKDSNFFDQSPKMTKKVKKLVRSSDFGRKKNEILTDKNNLQCCFNCILRLKRNKLGEKRLCWKFF